MPQAYLTHIQSFCAAHRLHNSSLSDEENKKHFGKCNHINSHGHNYKVEARVVGEVDPTTGMAINLTILKNLLIQVIDPLDHKRLDLDVEFFQKNVATAENIAIYIWNEMKRLLPTNVRLNRIRLHETEKHYIDFKGF